MTPVEWTGDIHVAANGDALGFNRAALQAMRHAAYQEKHTERPYDIDEGVRKLFEGIRGAALDYGAATYRTAKTFADIKKSDEHEQFWFEATLLEDHCRKQLLTLLDEAERSVRRHINGTER